MARTFLFMFGYEDVSDFDANAQYGTDGESSTGVFIVAPDDSAAMTWGRQIAEAFVGWIFARAGRPDPGWSAGGFAHWIETDVGRVVGAPELPTVQIGDLPDFAEMVPGRTGT